MRKKLKMLFCSLDVLEQLFLLNTQSSDNKHIPRTCTQTRIGVDLHNLSSVGMHGRHQNPSSHMF